MILLSPQLRGKKKKSFRKSKGKKKTIMITRMPRSRSLAKIKVRKGRGGWKKKKKGGRHNEESTL